MGTTTLPKPHKAPTFFAVVLLLYLLPSPSSAQQRFSTQTFTFESFNDSHRDSFVRLKDAGGINNGALQLTPDSLNSPQAYLQNKSGRFIFRQPFKLFESPSVQASFRTLFDVNLYRIPNVTVVGEGLAFVIVPDLSEPPPGSEGRFLGLTNATTDGDPANKLVAVELDTLRQSESGDPDDNHVGLDLNSVRSNVTASLSKLNIVLSPNTKDGTVYTVWVDYNGTSKRIDVYIANQTLAKPATPALSSSLDLSQHVAQNSYFGFAGSTGDNYELNCVKSWSMTIDMLPERNNPDVSGWALKAGFPAFVGLLLVLLCVGAFFVYRKKKEGEERLGDKLKSLPGMPKEYRYRELRKATNGFDERMKLGQGGYGTVYRGRIPGEATEVAVKTFSRETSQGDFLAELTIINLLRHRHLVPLLGWCYKNGRLLLVYEYMPNGSLDYHLFKAPATQVLSWDRRYTILSGVASAIHYLHNEYNQKVVHRDLKASNIMLDASFQARLGDFGLARAIDNERTSYVELELDGMPGTMGYIAPECLHTGRATRESDVFGFGAVVLEVVCGRRPWAEAGGFRLLSDWVWTLYGEGRVLEAVDENLGGRYEVDEAKRLLLLGLACSHPSATERPKAGAIVQIVSKSVPPPVVPETKPAFVWPSLPLDYGEETTGSVTAGERSGHTFGSLASSSASSYYSGSTINGRGAPQHGGGGGDAMV